MNKCISICVANDRLHRLGFPAAAVLAVPSLHSNRSVCLWKVLCVVDKWITDRRAAVLALGGAFQLTGLNIPIAQSGIRHSSATQIIRIHTEECRVLSSKKRAPYRLVYETVDLDEDPDEDSALQRELSEATTAHLHPGDPAGSGGHARSHSSGGAVDLTPTGRLTRNPSHNVPNPSNTPPSTSEMDDSITPNASEQQPNEARDLASAAGRVEADSDRNSTHNPPTEPEPREGEIAQAKARDSSLEDDSPTCHRDAQDTLARRSMTAPNVNIYTCSPSPTASCSPTDTTTIGSRGSPSPATHPGPLSATRVTPEPSHSATAHSASPAAKGTLPAAPQDGSPLRQSADQSFQQSKTAPAGSLTPKSGQADIKTRLWVSSNPGHVDLLT